MMLPLSHTKVCLNLKLLGFIIFYIKIFFPNHHTPLNFRMLYYSYSINCNIKINYVFCLFTKTFVCLGQKDFMFLSHLLYQWFKNKNRNKRKNKIIGWQKCKTFRLLNFVFAKGLLVNTFKKFVYIQLLIHISHYRDRMELYLEFLPKKVTLSIIVISLLMFDAASSLKDSCGLHSTVYTSCLGSGGQYGNEE